MEGILHTYHSKRGLLLFEHKPLPPPPTTNTATPTSPVQNTLLFIGGMYDNFQTPSYLPILASLFPSTARSKWRFLHAQLSSAGRSFGTSDLDKDISEMAVAIDFIRTKLQPPSSSTSQDEAAIVLMGHSTGCQDILHYLTSPTTTTQRPQVQGAILQAAASDRDNVIYTINTSPTAHALYEQALAMAKLTPLEKRRTVILPLDLTTSLFGPAPLTVSRFLSLVSPGSPEHPGLDDFFSRDLSAQRHVATFGSIAGNAVLKAKDGRQLSLLVLLSGADEFVPPGVDAVGLLDAWGSSMVGSGCVLDGESAVVANARHGYDRDDWDGRWARDVELRGRVLKYLDRVVGGIGEETWRVWEGGKKKLEKEQYVEKGVDVKL